MGDVADVYNNAFGQMFPPVQDNNMAVATKEMGLTPEEQNLYMHHLRNLNMSNGGVPFPEGTPEAKGGYKASLYQMGREENGREYNVPTVWGGAFKTPDEAWDLAHKEGLKTFPSYPTVDEAESRYTRMHDYMGEDMQNFKPK